jgi:hypothetical protein
MARSLVDSVTKGPFMPRWRGRFVVFAFILALAAWPVRVSAQAAAPASQAPAPKTEALRLSDNTVLIGHAVREDADTVVFDAGVLGQLTIRKTDIAARLDPAAAATPQAPPAAAAPPQAAAGGAFGTADRAVWSRSATFGGTYTSSPYDLGNLDPRFPELTGKALKLPGVIYQVQGQVSLIRATRRGAAMLDASTTYVFADNIGVQADTTQITVEYDFRSEARKRIYQVLRYTYSRDAVKHTTSNTPMYGVGFKAVEKPKVQLDLVPGLALQYDKKGTEFDNRVIASPGAFEQLVVKIGPAAQFEQRFFGVHAINERQYWAMQNDLAVKGQLNKIFGLSLTLTHTLDNVLSLRQTPIPANALFPGQPEFGVLANKRSQVTLTTGIQMKF